MSQVRPEGVTVLTDPTTLSPAEFISYAQFMLDCGTSMPLAWQHELLRRYVANNS